MDQLGMKGCICHFVKWQIHPFNTKVANDTKQGKICLVTTRYAVLGFMHLFQIKFKFERLFKLKQNEIGALVTDILKV